MDYPTCGVCGRRKKPIGRSLTPGMYDSWCTDDGDGSGCPGYYDTMPVAIWLWPDELDACAHHKGGVFDGRACQWPDCRCGVAE